MQREENEREKSARRKEGKKNVERGLINRKTHFKVEIITLTGPS